MNDARNIADAIGRQELARALDVGLTAVSNSVVAGRFPPAWFLCVQRYCREFDIECPPELFGMKGLGHPTDKNCSAGLKEDAQQ